MELYFIFFSYNPVMGFTLGQGATLLKLPHCFFPVKQPCGIMKETLQIFIQHGIIISDYNLLANQTNKKLCLFLHLDSFVCIQIVIKVMKENNIQYILFICSLRIPTFTKYEVIST